MTPNAKTPIPNETSTWQQPGAWRKPCIVHVTMVAKGREPIFGTLTHNGKQAEVEKTAIGWILINQQQRMLSLCPEIKILADKVMPDHHHIVLQVCRTMPRSIKEVVRGKAVTFGADGAGFLLALHPPIRRRSTSAQSRSQTHRIQTCRFRFIALSVCRSQ